MTYIGFVIVSTKLNTDKGIRIYCYLPSLSFSLIKTASTTAIVIRDKGLNIEGYVGPRSATAHDTKQKVAAVANAPCITKTQSTKNKIYKCLKIRTEENLGTPYTKTSGTNILMLTTLTNTE